MFNQVRPGSPTLWASPPVVEPPGFLLSHPSFSSLDPYLLHQVLSLSWTPFSATPSAVLSANIISFPEPSSKLLPPGKQGAGKVSSTALSATQTSLLLGLQPTPQSQGLSRGTRSLPAHPQRLPQWSSRSWGARRKNPKVEGKPQEKGWF